MPALTVQPLRPYVPFTGPDGILTLEGYQFLYNMFLRVGGSLDSLNAVTLADKTWDAPNPIGSTTPSTGKFTTLENTTKLTVGGGVTATGSGLKHIRQTTGSIGAGASALVTVTWATAFANSSYTVNASVQDSTAATASLKVTHIESISASAVVVRVENTSAGSLTGTLHLIAVHD